MVVAVAEVRAASRAAKLSSLNHIATKECLLLVAKKMRWSLEI